jgi:hypothetical protein
VSVCRLLDTQYTLHPTDTLAGESGCRGEQRDGILEIRSLKHTIMVQSGSTPPAQPILHTTRGKDATCHTRLLHHIA